MVSSLLDGTIRLFLGDYAENIVEYATALDRANVIEEEIDDYTNVFTRETGMSPHKWFKKNVILRKKIRTKKNPA